MNKILNEIQIKLRDLQARPIQHGYKLVILSLICSSLHQYLKLPRQGEYTDVSRPIKKNFFIQCRDFDFNYRQRKYMHISIKNKIFIQI